MMETGLDLSRWREKPRGVGYRRGAIVAAGLRELFQLRLFTLLVFIALGAGMVIAALGFLFSQSVGDGGLLQTLAGHLGVRFSAIVTMADALAALYPDVVIGALFTTIFWVHSFLGLGLSLLALTLVVPRLITRDRASHALTVYLSRPLTSADYLLGKLGTIVSVLLLVWTGPLLLGWLLSMVLAPDRDFIVHSFPPLLHALAFNAISLVVLAAVALGVSASAPSSRAAIMMWVALWVALRTLGKMPHAPDLIRRASFTHDLGEVRARVLRLDAALTDAGTDLPLLDQRFARELKSAGAAAEGADFPGALAGLGVFCVISSFVFLRRLRPE